MDSILRSKSLPSVSDTAVCYFTYTWQKLSRKHMECYFYTTSRSQQPAVVRVCFITRKNQQVYADPTDVWVKAFVNFLGTH
uniref:Chemokine interleukin-8-like domain-containing protein n=1 Tax=Calidris pygmaea TaxID=425635 RepID=A0A8C3JN94_9CHAR